jgi:uncharacterized protein YuzE
MFTEGSVLCLCVIVHVRKICLQDKYWIGINCWKARNHISYMAVDTVCRLMVVTLYHWVLVYERRIGLQDQYCMGINCWKACSRISARVGDTCCVG